MRCGIGARIGIGDGLGPGWIVDWGLDWGQVLQSHIVVMQDATPSASASNLITPTR